MEKITAKQKISLITLGLFLSAILLEIGLRLGGFAFSYIQDSRNRTAFRQKADICILCLGESTTASQYPGYLEEILNQKSPKIKFKVIDKGRGGTNSGVILSELEHNLDKYRPDIVITMIGINDLGGVLKYENKLDVKIKLFLRDFRIVKLINLARQHVSAKIIAHNIKGKKEASPAASQDYDFKLREKKLKEDIASNPEDYLNYVRLGCFYRDMTQYNKAIGTHVKAIKSNPMDYAAYAEMGNCFRSMGKYEKAERLFKKAIELNPEGDGWPYIELGYLYKGKGMTEAALTYFHKAAGFADDNALMAAAEEAGLYSLMGEYKKSEELFKNLAAKYPDNTKIVGGLALSYELQKKNDLARECFGKQKDITAAQCYSNTHYNYQKIKDVILRRDIKMIAMQYPMRNITSLKKMLEPCKGIIFVDNEKLFKDAIENSLYGEYFIDCFGGDFGHCTEKGNRILAENIANTLFKELF